MQYLQLCLYEQVHMIKTIPKSSKVHMSRHMGIPTICICENKDADQLRGNREADQRLCFRYMDSTIPLLLKSEISSFQSASMTVQPDLCQTCSETTLLVFSRDGSYDFRNKVVAYCYCRFTETSKVFVVDEAIY